MNGNPVKGWKGKQREIKEGKAIERLSDGKGDQGEIKERKGGL